MQDYIDTTNYVPKYIQLRDILKDQILRGRLKTQERIPSINELIKQYKISDITVRKTLDMLTNEGLLQRIQGKGTFIVRQTAMEKKSVNVRFVLTGTNQLEPFYAQVFRGVEMEAARQGYDLLYTCLGELKNEEEEDYAKIEQFGKNEVGGIILAGNIDVDVMADIKKLPYPVVIVGHQRGKVKGWQKVNRVDYDHANAGESALDFLSELGHMSIIVISGPEDPHFMEILSGCRKAIDRWRAKGRQMQILFAETIEKEAGYAVMQRALEAGTTPTAIFAADDWLAMGAIEAVQDSGMQVPEDISVLGFGDRDFAAKLRPPLTTVKVPRQQIGITAFQTLMACMKTPAIKPGEKMLMTEIVTRDSCKNLKGTE